MAPPSPLVIATSSLQRLVKEESSYHKELEQQQARIQKLESEGGDENAEFMINQQRKAIDETKAVFPELKEKIRNALGKLEMQLESVKESGTTNPDEITKAKEVVSQAWTSLREVS